MIPITLFLLAAPVLALGQAPAPGAAGYVVRVDSSAVYLDFGEASGASVGQSFKVYSEGEELKHPVTGQSLGRVESTLASGTLREIQRLYSVGALSSSSAEIRPGMRARLGEKPAPPAPSPAAAASAAPSDENRQPRFKSATFDYRIAGMAVADFKGDGGLTVALADESQVSLYAYPPKNDKPLAQFTVPGVGTRILSLEAGDLNGNGRAELFVTFYHQTLNRVGSIVLELDGGQWKQQAELPWIVRGHQDGSGKTVLAVQQLVEDPTFPFSNIYPLVFKDGKYGPGKETIRHKRVDWIYDFTTASLDGHAPALLYLTSTNHLRVQFDKGYWKTPEPYGQTPIRLRWPRGDGRLLEFHPPMPVGYDGEHARVYLARNLSMLGSLSEPFGLFNSGEIHRASWNGVSLARDWKAEIGGYSTALALVRPTGQAADLAVAVVGTSGKSALWIYDP